MMDIFRLARSRLAGIRPDTRGNTTMVFGLCLVPLIVMAGLGVDYGTAMANKTKLDAAADAAAIAAVATAKAYMADNPGDATAVDDAIAAAKSRATNAFYVNAGNVPFTQFTLAPPDVQRQKQTFSAAISYTATTANHFGQVVGVKSFSWKGGAQAVADVPSYLDFYLLLDVSGSMGLPSTVDGMNELAQHNPDNGVGGCQFACHYKANDSTTGKPYVGWDVAKARGIQLRSGAVNDAVCKLLDRAAVPAIPDQYRIGLYPFINQMATLQTLSSDAKSGGVLQTAADCASSPKMAFTNLLDQDVTQLATGNDPTTGTGAGGTHFETTLQQMRSTIAAYGDGSSAQSPKPFVFIITDGMQNNQHFFDKNYYRQTARIAYPGNPGAFPGYGVADWDSSSPRLMNPTYCQALKTAGATISVLYIPYVNLPIPSRGSYTIWEAQTVDALTPQIPNVLRSCATDGYFYTANTPQDITNALNAMFDQAVQMAHLKQ